MRKKLHFAIPGLAALALVLGLVAPAQAITLTPSSPEFLGTITPDVPADETSEESYINHLVGMTLGDTDTFSGQSITRSNNDPGGGVYPLADFQSKDESGDNTFTLTGTFTYLLGKYDAQNAGAWVWYIADLPTGTEIEIPSTFTSGHGLSHFSLFTVTTDGEEPPTGGEEPSVPEPASLLLLGFGALAAGRRVRSRFAA